MLKVVLKVPPNRPGRAAWLARAKPRARVSWGHFRDFGVGIEPISALSLAWGGPPDPLRRQRRGVGFFLAVTGLASRALFRVRCFVVEWSRQIWCAFAVIYGRFEVK